MVTPAEKRARFRELHERGCFVLPNPWDVGSARMLAALGFQALASTSSGMAWTNGGLDNETSLPTVLAHLEMLAGATDLPLNADFEDGHADGPEGVAANVAKALAAGVAGVSIEDMSPAPGKPLYPKAEAVARLRAARAAIDAEGSGAILVGRAEGMLMAERNLSDTLDRLVALADAGADCLYAPGLRTPDEITAAVKAVAPKPLNVLIMDPKMTAAQLADLGVRRISLGGALARTAWGGFLRTARRIAESGDFSGLAEAATGGEIAKLLRP
jgi:2-methylisocitrate lyase-like PEP mutase family enzyme